MGATGNAFKLTVTLLQQTRMIHFQHDEEGVCLRAGEVKPKLDRFIFSLLGGGDSPDDIEKGYKLAKEDKKWTIGEHRSLDYKMKIRAPRGSKSGDCSCHPLYFADQIKLAIFYKESIKLTIICFKKELREMIEENIALFFVLYNFGTRQTKGFGSFLVENKDNHYDPFKILKDYYLNTLKRSFVFTKVSPASDWDSLNVAKTLYNLLKGGINIPKRFYEKSFLTCTFLNRKKRIEGEKAFIKNRGYLQNPLGTPIGNSKNYRFIRALLGLPEYYDFPKAPALIKVEDPSGDIERFASPVLIKIFGDYVILLPGLIPDELLKGQEDGSGRKKDREFHLVNEAGRTEIIKMPSSFNLSQLLVDFADHFNKPKLKDNLRKNFGADDFYKQKDKKDYKTWKKQKRKGTYKNGERISGLTITKEEVVAP